jgi:hypothetical protein
MSLALELAGLRSGVLLKNNNNNYRGKFKKQKKLD